MSDASGAFVLAGRILIAVFFGIFAGIMGHMRSTKGMEQYAQAMRFPAPAIAGWPTGIWLVLAAISVGFGIWGDLGSLMIIAFLAVAAAYFHRFWEVEDQAQQMVQNQLFFRNVIGVAGLLVLFAVFAGTKVPFTLTDGLFSF